MLLQFPDPAKLRTKQVVFKATYCARDCGTLEELKNLSSMRRAIEESINGSSFVTDAVAREMAGGLTSRIQQDLKKLECYLPLLENLVLRVESVGSNSKMHQWTSDHKIQWTSVLNASSIFNLGGPKFFRIDSFRFELGMVLFLYGAVLRERALEILSADIVQSAILYRKAAGVYQYLAQEVLPPLQPAIAQEIPLEATPPMASVMSLVCLAEAQAITIRRAEEKASSGSLLAKLHYGVTQLFEEAAYILNSKAGDLNDVSERLTSFISLGSTLHEVRSQRYMADELKSAGHIGVAVGILRYATANFQGKMPSEDSWRQVFQKETDDLGEMLRRLEHENEFIWHHKIARADELPFLEGKRIVTAIPYCPLRSERELLFKI